MWLIHHMSSGYFVLIRKKCRSPKKELGNRHAPYLKKRWWGYMEVANATDLGNTTGRITNKGNCFFKRIVQYTIIVYSTLPLGNSNILNKVNITGKPMRNNHQGTFFVFAICIFALTPINTKCCMLNLYKFKVFRRKLMDYLKRHAPLKARSRLN